MRKTRVPNADNRFIDKRSKLTDSSFELALNMRYPIEGKIASWNTISQRIGEEYGISVSEQAVSQLLKRYQDIFIINKLSDKLLQKRKSKIQNYYMKSLNKPDIKFRGALILEKSAGDTTLKIYSTENCNMVLSKTVNGQTDAINALLVEDLTDFFGWSDLAKDIYDSIGVQRYIEVE